ncbi:MAG: Eco57I restriction-modification methylase domain-containing protein [Corynebacterium casei]|uniref:Eco57I restriction-modification methylase domain-containing protein n=1 Tax=Corynebacterium casei TaxID=160386 RepID=UPI003F8E3C44
MPAFDSIVNVEEWISDHYLTTDETKGASYSKRVAERIKLWKSDEAATEQDGPLTRFTSARLAIQTALAGINIDDNDQTSQADEATRASALIRNALGYGGISEQTAQRGSDTIEYSGWSGNAGSVQLLEALPIASPEDVTTTGLLSPIIVSGAQQESSAANLMGQMFLSDQAPAYIICIAGSWVVVAERETWPLGRYFAINLGLVVERNDTKAKGEIQQAVVALARENTERSADGTTWWDETIEQSRQHAVQVSGELRGSVRESIEIIGNDILNRRRAKGLPIDNIDGAELAKQALRYLYRILFLLFAEASPELEILPTGSPEYDEGYGLARLRELVLDPPVTHDARNGTHLYESLQLLFTLVDKGHNPTREVVEGYNEDATEPGLSFRNLSADLFLPSATALIDEVKLSNEALNKVLENLLLSKVKSGKDRGFISYATLGVTELGQVYEGLMSFTGFIAEEDLYEVAPEGKADKGSWMLPVSRANDVPADSFVMYYVEVGGGYRKERRRHPRGSFVFRQSSRDRERSASFYTPQVLTSFTVGQAIDVLKESGRISNASDILSLKICEPAMGSGAFAVETVRQLAELYLEMRQEELGEQIDAEIRAKEFQKVKAHIALHQVYGVDLNATAVELAEISLWLDTMNADMDAPWYGLHLRRGNALVGATRSIYSPSQLSKKAWLTETPTRKRLDDIAEAVANDASEAPTLAEGIHHFLLPSNGWGAPADAKDLKNIVPDEIKALKSWRSSIRKALTKPQIKKVNGLARRVEALWRYALLRVQIAETQVSRNTDVWGQEPVERSQAVTREQIEKDLFENLDGAYNRLRLVMDAWCAFWYWPLDAVPTEQNPDRPALPDLDEWLDALTAILGVDVPLSKRLEGHYVIGQGMSWLELNEAENSEIEFSGALKIARVIESHPWLETSQKVAKDQGFFHWDLDFADVFARGGFDLQVGNPPWVRPRTDLDSLLAETDPWFSLAKKPTQAEKRERQELLRSNAFSTSTVTHGVSESVSTSAVLGSVSDYPHLQGQQSDLYRGFMERTWSNISDEGVVSLIHPESHFTEKKAAPLRRGAYQRLRRHWQFINALMLFDIDDHVVYGVHVYSSKLDSPDFLNAGRMYHPQTAAESLQHDGSGPLPGIKDDNFNWDRRPHKDRIQIVDLETLKVWKSILEDKDTPLLDSRMVYTVNTEAASVLKKLAEAPRIKELGLQFSSGWHESADKKKGYFDVGWKHPASWSDVILQGPHLGVSTPMIKQPNPTLKHNQDWSEVDLEAMPDDFIPATGYQPNRADKQDYFIYGMWEIDGQTVPVSSTYRIAWRLMAATTGFRTFYPALIPPGARHIDGVFSAGPIDTETALTSVLSASSLIGDFLIRSTGIANLRSPSFENLPLTPESPLRVMATREFLRLNCLTRAYADIWEKITGEQWTPDVPVRTSLDRLKAQSFIDVAIAITLGITAEELCMIYRTQFPVMRRYDQEALFDRIGRRLPKEVLRSHQAVNNGEKLSAVERTWVHPQSEVTYLFEYPFRTFDREEEIRRVYKQYT